ncbi:MAG: 50S ribosomal protein L29 [bacterium]
MKPAELRRLGLPELEEKARTLRGELFGFGIQHHARQLAKPSQLRATRRDLARVLTLTAQKRKEGVAS